jgi:plasmid stabilization system protein ParE
VNEVIISPRARRDLNEAYAYIAQDSPQAADRVLDDLVSIFHLLAAGDLNGPEVILPGGRRAQRWSRRSYRIYYRRTARRTTILRVYHGSRRPIE